MERAYGTTKSGRECGRLMHSMHSVMAYAQSAERSEQLVTIARKTPAKRVV